MPPSSLKYQFEQTKPGDLGILGDPVEHSLSPVMQNAALQFWWRRIGNARQTAPVYHKFHVRSEELQEAIHLMEGYQLRGANVTIPHKQAAAAVISILQGMAQKTGSLNTLARSARGWIGYNTDGIGFLQALERDAVFSPQGKSALVLGAGGTGLVLVHALLDAQAQEIYWWNRNAEKLKDFMKTASLSAVKPVLNAKEIPLLSEKVHLIANATSVGLSETDERPPCPSIKFKARQTVFDVIYHRKTRFMKDAEKAGARVLGGLGMLLYQGAASFEIWTGSKAPVDTMRNVLTKALIEKGIEPLWPSAI